MNKKTEAKCNGSMLTVGFHSAHPPLIWRFDLERNHSFTLSLQGDEGDWELGITTPKGDFYPVVHFVAREDAEEALVKVERTLANKKGGSLIRKTLVTLGIIAILLVGGVTLLGTYVNNKGKHLSSAMPSFSSATEGVPVPADQVLQPPQ